MTSATAPHVTVREVRFAERDVHLRLPFRFGVVTLTESPQARPVIIDESDGEIDSAVIARARGYRGVSTKSCKGFYKSVINAVRCAFLQAHPDLYARTAGAVRLRILDGRLSIGSLACPGYARSVEPDWTTMRVVA
jgi:hypothetical protein